MRFSQGSVSCHAMVPAVTVRLVRRSCPRRRASARSALALGLALRAEVGRADSGETLGCFWYGWRFSPPMGNVTNPLPNIANRGECQLQCQGISGCAYFALDVDRHECWLSGSDMNQVQRDARFIAGPRVCLGVSPLCTQLPGVGFPGATPEASNRAWPAGIVPPRLQCWPRDAHLDFTSCSTEQVTVLDSTTADNWPGRCYGLHRNHQAEVDADRVHMHCQSSCERNASCGTWQTVQSSSLPGMECWQGVGRDCTRARSDIDVVAAQRFQHGSYRVLMDLKGYFVENLKRVFPITRFSDHSRALTACKNTCLSDIMCEVWTYSNIIGCSVNDPSFKDFPHPPTTSVFRPHALGSPSVIAGEYIQRICKNGDDTSSSPSVSRVAPVGLAPQNSGLPLATQATTTSHAPEPLAIALVDRFIRGRNSGFTYFQDHETNVKHLVRNGCAFCDAAANCEHYVVVSDWYVDSLSSGEDFECNMVDAMGAVGSQEEMLTTHLKDLTELPPPPPIKLTFTVLNLKHSKLGHQTLLGSAASSVASIVKEKLAAEAGCSIHQVSVQLSEDKNDDVKIDAGIAAPRYSAAGTANVQHIQSQLSRSSGAMAQDMVFALQSWARTHGGGSLHSDAAPFGIASVETSIPGAEHLPGYVRTSTTTTVTQTTVTTTVTTSSSSIGVTSSLAIGAMMNNGANAPNVGQSQGINWTWPLLTLILVLAAGFIARELHARMRKRKTRGANGLVSSESEHDTDASEGEEDAEDGGAHSHKQDTSGGSPERSRSLQTPLMDAESSIYAAAGSSAYDMGEMDLVQVTSEGLSVTPLVGPPPPGVPVYDVAQLLSGASSPAQAVSPAGSTLPGPPVQSGGGWNQHGALSPVPTQTGALNTVAHSVARLSTQTALPIGPSVTASVTQMPPAPVGTQMAMAPSTLPSLAPSMAQPEEEYDLVTVTKDGLQVTPLQASQAPVGIPIFETEMQRTSGLGTSPCPQPSFQQLYGNSQAMPTTVFR